MRIDRLDYSPRTALLLYMSALNFDIWSHVFQRTVDDDPSSLTTIRSVDRTWFHMAGQIPQLWSRLEFGRTAHFLDCEYALLYLQKSRGLPIDISITLPNSYDAEKHRPCFSRLRNEIERIKTLTVVVPFHQDWQNVISDIGKGLPAPILERLSLRVWRCDPHMTEFFTVLPTAFTPSPKLTHLELPGWPMPDDPFPQLSSILSLSFDTPFHGMDVPELFPIIQDVAPRLEHFKYKSYDMGSDITPSFSSVTALPCLRTVSVTTPGTGLQVLENFDAPCLTSVTLDGRRDFLVDRDRDPDEDALRRLTNSVHLLSTRSPRIRRLELIYHYFQRPTEDYKFLLSGQGFPELEELIMTNLTIPNAAFMESAETGNSTLKILDLRNCKISANAITCFGRGSSRNKDFLLRIQNCPGINLRDLESLSEVVRVEG